jgi:hypothetical protein
MSVECERVFSSTKKLITSERNRLAEEIIEASECLKNWWGRELIQQLEEEEAVWGTSEVVEACGNLVCILHSHYCMQFYLIVKPRRCCYEHWPLGAWRMSWRCGLGTQVILFVVSHAVFLSSFFRLDVQV